MVGHEGGRWDVAAKDKAVYLQRVSDGDEPLFEDSLTPEEARALAGLLTKYADKAGESRGSGEAEDSDESGHGDEDTSGDEDKSGDEDTSGEDE
ncbi:hypothetical protein [Mycobacterium colombiense]|uniref:hypothetical protein n=1 Tax=Mycobacterium colombiense TaxID=339268 RepID=UPI00200B5967|nr:hypothetical protein [Mycobacterium colombiense]MCK8645594.1 hypothetical protein [Mycobacterium colombiense]